MKCLSVVCLGLFSMVSAVFSQEVVEPNYGVAELKFLQDSAGADGDEVKATYRELNVQVSANSEVWIPLGVYKYGDYHRLNIEAEGESTVANGSLDFTLWFNAPSPTVFKSTQLSVAGRYQIYYFKHQGSIALVAKYTNTSTSSNEFRLTHFSPRKTSWSYYSPNATDLASAKPVKSAISVVEVDQEYSNYELVKGVTINEKLYVKGDTVLEGNVTVINPQGDISMGEFSE